VEPIQKQDVYTGEGLSRVPVTVHFVQRGVPEPKGQIADWDPFSSGSLSIDTEAIRKHIVKLDLLPEEPPQGLKLLPAVEGEVAQFIHKGQGTVPNTGEQIHQVAVVVVVDLRQPLLRFPAKEEGPAPAEHLHIPVEFVGEQPVQYGPQGGLSSHPGDKGFQSLSPHFRAQKKRRLS